jgi:hypothetical protein
MQRCCLLANGIIMQLLASAHFEEHHMLGRSVNGELR